MNDMPTVYREGESGPRRRGAVAVVVRDRRLLVIERSQRVEAPGAICFPGGGIEAGESQQQAIVRELQEELGVPVAPLRRLWASVTDWQVELSWWLTELDEAHELRPNPDEVAAVHWLTVEEIRAHPQSLSSNIEFLDAVDVPTASLQTARGRIGG